METHYSSDEHIPDGGTMTASEKSTIDYGSTKNHQHNTNDNDENKHREKDDEETKKDDGPKKEDELDEEGLKRSGYDIILFGTGLTQAILASALTRAGKSVLHCDGNDFYGEKDAVFSLGAIMDWTQRICDIKDKQGSSMIKNDLQQHEGEDTKDRDCDKNAINVNPAGALSSFQIHYETNNGPLPQLKSGMSVVTPYGHGIIQNLPSSDTSNADRKNEGSCSLAVKLNNWTMADGKSPIAYFGYKNESSENEKADDTAFTAYYAKNHDIIPKTLFQFQHYVLARKRNYALDLTPGLLYANGEAVDGLLESGVSGYCEFKSLLGLHLFLDKKDSSKKSTRTATSSKIKSPSTNGHQYQLSHVPCSKRDVFQTKLLSPVEKRKLMKFLQMAFDYATSASMNTRKGNVPGSDETETKSETDTTSVTDEQIDNKALLEADAVTSLNERQLQQGRSLYRPQNKTVSTSDLERLQVCINEGMNFEEYLEVEHKLPPRLRDIVIYALAMGSNNHHGDSTYSVKNGMSDLSQHLQSLGKYGGTAFLVPLYGAGELSQSFCRSAAVHGGTYLLRRAITKVLLCKGGDSVRGVLLNEDSYEDTSKGEATTQKKEIKASHVIVPSDAIQMKQVHNHSKGRVLRRISILRGKLHFDTNSNIDSNECSEQRHIIVIPPNTIGNKSVIHGIVLDESVHVAPNYYKENFSSTILHLTTTIEEGSKEIDLLQTAMQSIIENQIEAGVNNLEEIYHLSFSYKSMNSGLKEICNGLHICDSYQSITVESAFREASSIFNKICPTLDFLKYSQEMDEKVKESRVGIVDDDDDQEKAVLESAMDMMSSSTAEKES